MDKKTAKNDTFLVKIEKNHKKAHFMVYTEVIGQ